jgi:16S rRNA (cytosine967-C5)-methyltransferase
MIYCKATIMDILRVKRKCLEILERVEFEGAYLHIVLQKEAERPSKAPEEYPIVVQLVRGVLEQRQTLESLLEPMLPQGIGSLPVEIQLILKLGAYQICFLDRVKKRDVVFEAVELVKKGRYRGLAGLVNAVLRKVGSSDETSCSSLVVESSEANFPVWLIERWYEQFGADEVKAFCAASDRPLPLYLRVNTNRITPSELEAQLRREGLQVERSDLSPVSLKVLSLPSDKRIQHLKSFTQGLFFIQDLSSTLVSDLVGRNAPSLVRDLCAAPGGKTCSVALSIQGHGGQVHASDRVASRVRLVDKLTSSLGVVNVTCWEEDASVGAGEASQLYDAVLVDAPCSGFGTVGRKVDARWSKSPEIFGELVELQARLLDRAAKLVRPGGGVLVYSTCSIDRAENEEVSEAFLARTPGFVHSPVSEDLPKYVCTAEGFYRAWPHRHQMAGAFAARFLRAD